MQSLLPILASNILQEHWFRIVVINLFKTYNDKKIDFVIVDI